MKLTGFDYDVSVLVTMTGHEIARLMKLSKSHYDGKCKAAGNHGGFLYGFMNRWDMSPPVDLDEEIELMMTGHELGTLGKIGEAESPADYPNGSSGGFTLQFSIILESRMAEYHRIGAI